MKNKKKKILRYGLIAILSIILVMVMISLFNPLRCSEEKIRTRLLEQIPIGTYMNDVIDYINSNKKWRIHGTYSKGYALSNGGQPRVATSGTAPEKIIGTQAMEVYLGEYRSIICVDVSVYLGFDENGRLVDIAVVKEYDSL